ncbi:MAG: hypothetical protein H7222_01290 [Methylotenera sp.]|nr:hypothetical protein [Oligoflexia bacterium]
MRLHSLAVFGLSASLVISLSGCSKDMFSRGGDDGIAQGQSYHRINPNCQNVDLSGKGLNPTVLKSFVKCLNAYGALEPIQQLISQTPDSDLEPVTAALNRYLFENPTALFQIENTIQALGNARTADNRVVYDDLLDQVGKVLSHPQLITSLLQALDEGSSSDALQALEQFSSDLTPEGTLSFLNATASVVESDSVQGLEKKLSQPGEGSRDLLTLSQGIHQFLINDDKAQSAEVSRQLLQATLSGQLFEFWDQVMGTQPSEFRERIPQHTALMTVLFADEGRIVQDVASLHHVLADPLLCLNGAKQVSDLPVHLLRELTYLKPSESAADYIARVNLLTLIAVKPFCQFPKELGKYYGSMVELVESTVSDPAIDLLKKLYSFNLAKPVLGFIGGTGPQNQTGFHLLVPVFSELSKRDAWADLLLSLTVLHPQDREKLTASLGTLSDRPAIHGKNVYEIAFDSLGQVRPSTLHSVLKSVSEIFGQSEPFLAPLLKSLRSGYYVNDVHPFIDLSKKFLNEASTQRAVFSSISKISQRRQFVPALEFLGKMSKDGQLKELVAQGLTLFHKNAQRGQTRIKLTSEPRFFARRAHNLTSKELSRYAIKFFKDPTDPCRKLSIDVRFEDQISDFMKCSNQNHHYDSLQNAFQVLSSNRTSDGSRNFLQVPMDLINRFDLKKEQANELVNSALRALKDGTFRTLTALLPATLTQSVLGKGAILQPLLAVNAAVMRGARLQMRHLMDLGAKMLEHKDLPTVLAFSEKINQATVHPAPRSPGSPVNRDRVRQWVKAAECISEPTTLDARTDEVIDDFRNSIVGWELTSTGDLRRNWTIQEFKDKLEPVLSEFGDLDQSAPEKTLLQAGLNVLRYFSLKPGQEPNRTQHYTAADLTRFVQMRSIDYQPISYFYPGQKVPRLRLASTLDRLEIVLLNADFKYVLPENFAMKFLAMIGNAWGDEPDPNKWPVPVQEEYNRTGRRSQTLREAYNTILKMVSLFEKVIRFPKVGYCGEWNDPEGGAGDADGDVHIPQTPHPRLPKFPVPFRVKTAFYNMKQVLSVLEENLPDSTSPMAGGILPFRDLFYEFYSSTPARSRNAVDVQGNHLNVVTRLVRLGLTRELSRIFMHLDSDEETSRVSAMIRALTQVANSPDAAPFLQNVLSQKGQPLVYRLLDEVFHALSRGEESQDHLRQLAFYGLIDLSRMGLINPGIKALSELSSDSRNLDYLSSGNSSWISSLLTSPEAAHAALALYEDRNDRGGLSTAQKTTAGFITEVISEPEGGLDLFSVLRSIDADSAGRKGLVEFIDRSKSFKELSTPSRESVKELAKDLLHFMNNNTPAATLTRQQTAATVRRFLADRIRSVSPQHGSGGAPGELEEFMLLAADKPDDFYQILTGFADFTQSVEFDEFLELLQRTIHVD